MPDTIRERAVMLAHDEGKEIEYRIHGDSAWRPTTAPAWNWTNYDYRVKPTKQRVPRTMDELPKGGALWVRFGPADGGFSVTSVGQAGVQALNYSVHVLRYSEDNRSLEISSDRETWLPWWKEVEA